MNANDMNNLFLSYINPFAPRFNNHLLVIGYAVNKWESLDPIARNELIMIYNDLFKFSKESNIASRTNDEDQIKQQFGGRYQQLMKSITQKPIYVESLKDWAIDNERAIEERISMKTNINVRADLGIDDTIYNNQINELLNMAGIDDCDKKYMVAQLDFLRNANQLLAQDELGSKEGKSR